MPNYRRDRINDAVAQESALILRDVKDPRVVGAMLSVTRAQVTGDLKNATIYVSALSDVDEKELKTGLRNCAGFFRSELAKRLNLRVTPAIAFVLDKGIRHGSEIASILKNIAPELEKDESTEADDD